MSVTRLRLWFDRLCIRAKETTRFPNAQKVIARNRVGFAGAYDGKGNRYVYFSLHGDPVMVPEQEIQIYNYTGPAVIGEPHEQRTG